MTPDQIAKAVEPFASAIKQLREGQEQIIGEQKSFNEILRKQVAEAFNTKAWEAGIYRENDMVQHNVGQTFIATKDTSDEPGTSEDWMRVGTHGFRFRGGLKSGMELADGDLFIKSFSLWMRLSGEDHLIAKAGRDGEVGKPGDKGEKGETGYPGRDGRDGHDGADIKDFSVANGFLALTITKAGKAETLTVDLEAIYKKQLEDVKVGLFESVQDITKNAILDSFNHPDDAAVPLKFFRGLWSFDNEYARGDVVIYDAKMFIAEQDNSRKVPGGGVSISDPIPSDPNWRKVIGGGGGGGGGGDSVALNLISQLQNQVDAIQTGLLHQVAVESIAVVPPTTPKSGDRYIVGSGATGAFAGHDDKVAFYDTDHWEFEIPKIGNTHYVNDIQKSMVWNGVHWVMLPRQAKVSLQSEAPLSPNEGDTWLDNSGSKLEIKYWDGTSWITSSGTRTFSQHTDPSLISANQVKEGDVWIHTFPQDTNTGLTPTPITNVRTGGSWSTTTPSIPASSRTYMQAETPTAGARGDTWIDVASGKPVIKFYDGTSWIDQGGTRTFSQNTDPKKDVPPKVVNEGDLWSDATDPKAVKIYQWTASAWVQVNAGGGVFVPEAPPALVKGLWSRRFTRGNLQGSSFNDVDTGFRQWKIEKDAAACPVPAKYKVGAEHFRITLFFIADAAGNGALTMTNCITSFNFANSYWYTDRKINNYSAQNITGTSTFYCPGSSDAMQWMNCAVSKSPNPVAVGDWPDGFAIREVMVTWELLSV